MLDRSTLRQRFIEDGLVVVDDAIPRDVVDDIVSQLQRELADPVVRPESGSSARASSGDGVDLEDPGTWPRGNARRVIEVVPPGEGRAWAAVLDSPALGDGLDAVLGREAWGSRRTRWTRREGTCEPRHWYCPITFPERDSEEAELRLAEERAKRARAASEKRRKTSGRAGRRGADADDVDGVHEQGRAEVAGGWE